jgi:sugar/nucleoside kinase (ribokinase family)
VAVPAASLHPRALFVGLCTLDIIQSVDQVPSANEKLTARRQTMAAGGPATNAAVTFSHLGGEATLLTGVGRHPLATGIKADLDHSNVQLIDLCPEFQEPPSVSTIMVTAATGERAVVSTNARNQGLVPPPNLSDLVAGNAVVQVDGHHPDLAAATARDARKFGRLTILDGGSWKAGIDRLLPHIDVAVCSSDFHPPGAETVDDVLSHLLEQGVRWAAVTHGNKPIIWQFDGGRQSVPVPQIKVVDTLGAGDIFHGALAFALASLADELDAGAFATCLSTAATVAATSCGSFGTRSWMTQ